MTFSRYSVKNASSLKSVRLDMLLFVDVYLSFNHQVMGKGQYS